MEEKVYYIEFLFDSGQSRELLCKTEADYNEARVVAETSFGKAMVATFRKESVSLLVAMKNVVALRYGIHPTAVDAETPDEDSIEEDHF